MGSQIASYSHVAICVSDVERAREFYEGVLQLPELERPSFDFPGAWYQVGGLMLHLMQREQPSPPQEGIGPHFALYVPTAEFEATVETLRSRGAEMVMEPSRREDTGVWAAFCQDPDGNLIELTDLAPVS